MFSEDELNNLRDRLQTLYVQQALDLGNQELTNQLFTTVQEFFNKYEPLLGITATEKLFLEQMVAATCNIIADSTTIGREYLLRHIDQEHKNLITVWVSSEDFVNTNSTVRKSLIQDCQDRMLDYTITAADAIVGALLNQADLLIQERMKRLEKDQAQFSQPKAQMSAEIARQRLIDEKKHRLKGVPPAHQTTIFPIIFSAGDLTW